MSQPPGESELLDLVEQQIRTRLPAGWRAEFAPVVGQRPRPDAILVVTSPSGEVGEIIVKSRSTVEPRSVAKMLEAPSVDPPMLVSRFISPRAQNLLAGARASYADATGNLRLVLARPAVWIADRGAMINPWRETRDLRSLKGRSAARVVRALCDWSPPFKVRELAERSGASLGSTARTLEFLDREALIARDSSKRVADVETRALVERWAQDFRFTEQNEIRRMFEPRALGSVVRKLADLQVPYAITGSFAAAEVAPETEPRLLAFYARDPGAIVAELGLRSGTANSNVWVAHTRDDLPMLRSRELDGLTYAAPSQVACDLFDMPGRSPSEATAVLAWMERHPDESRPS